ncbi:MAG TPA: hypothetical protein PKI45_05705 [Candidatus Omnitrophota bacterium]|nr:hypothetical protein [Candidatus Omnitrophota bacterium]
MTAKENNRTSEIADLAESQLQVLKKNLSFMKTPDRIDVPDARLNCCAVLSGMIAHLDDLASVCDDRPESAAFSVLDLEMQLENIKTEANKLATEIMSIWPPPLESWSQRVALMEQCFLKIWEILKIDPTTLPTRNKPTPSVAQEPVSPSPEELSQTENEKNVPTPKEFTEKIPGATDQAKAPEKVEPQVEGSEAPSPALPQEPVPPISKPEGSPATGNETAQEFFKKDEKKPETPIPALSDSPNVEKIVPPQNSGSQASTEVARSSPPTVPWKNTDPQPKPPKVEPEKEKPSKPANRPGKTAQPFQTGRPKPSTTPKQQRQNLSFLIHQAAEKHKELTQKSAPQSVPGPEKQPSQPEHEKKTEPPQEPKFLPVDEDSHRDSAIEILQAFEIEIVKKMEKVERLLNEPKENNSSDIVGLFASLKKQIAAMLEHEQDLQTVLPDGFRPQASSLNDRLSKIEEAWRSVKKAALPQETAPSEKPDPLIPPEPLAPSAKVPDPIPPRPVKPEKKKENLWGGIAPQVPKEPAASPRPVSPKRERSVFWEMLFRGLKFFIFFVLIALLLVLGVSSLMAYLRGIAGENLARKPITAAQPKETPPVAFEPFLRVHPKSLEKRSLTLMITYFYKNPDPAVRKSIVSMLKKWPWKGVPEVLLEIAANDPDGLTSQEAITSFQKITGYTVPGKALPEDAKKWWQEHKSEIDPRLEDAE